jgi:hypothetical protein
MFVTLENIISNCLHWKKDSHSQNIDVVMMIDFHLPNFRYCGFCWHGLSRIYRGNPIKWVCFLQHPHDHNLIMTCQIMSHTKTQIIFLTSNPNHFSWRGYCWFESPVYCYSYKVILTWLSIIAISISWIRVCLRFLLRVRCVYVVWG